MKKLWMFAIAYFLVYLGLQLDCSIFANSNDYSTFVEITPTKGKLLKNFTKDDYDKYYSKVNKKLFMGWRIYQINQNIECSFVSGTEYSFYNRGATPIIHKLNSTEETVTRISLSATGNIEYTKGVTVEKKFKSGLSSSLKLEGSYSQNMTIKKVESMELVIEPGSACVIYITGIGEVTNGVACRYNFWVRTIRGGFEFFVIKDIYQRIEKQAI